MNDIKTILQTLLRMPGNIYTGIMLRTDRSLFASLFNIKSMLLQSPARIRWTGNCFVVTDKSVPEFRYQVRHKLRCHFSYSRGIRKRAEHLARSYSFDGVGFADGDLYIDCGANYGDTKAWFDLNGLAIEYVGFEPSPVEFKCMKENVRPGVAHNLGLWNSNGELKFYVSSGGADSSLIKPVHYDEIITTKVRRLDSFLTSKVKCLKLEAEGAEPEILEGIGDKLSLIEYIAADLGYERGVEEESTLPAVTNYLLSRGFELISVDHDRVCALYRNLAIQA